MDVFGKCLLALGFAVLLSACETVRPMTYAQWKAEQAKKARIEQIKRQAKEMRELPVVITPEEQAAVGKR